MSADELVYPGELLLIRTEPTPLPSMPTLAVTNTVVPTMPFWAEPSIPTSVSAQPSAATESIASAPVKIDASVWTVIMIILLALFMAGLVTWLSGRERN